ncbi:MAG: TolC family outer membrane protein [Rhodobacteraceae bacterium]|nr:TolC family outer membrane protein [Paracoccaceae bacterium]
MSGSFSRGFKSLAGAASLIAALISSAQAESLGDALISAYKASDLLAQNQAVLRAADEDAATAVANLRPVLSFILQSQRTDTPLSDSTANSGILNFDWTIYDFGRSRLGLDIAREAVLSTRQALVGVEQNVLLSAVRAYMDLRRASQTAEVNRTSVNLISEQLKAAQDRFAVGEITRTDVALAEARLAAAKAGLAAAEGDLDVARASYKAEIGHAPDGRTSLPAAPAFPKTLGEAQAIAQRLHPAVLQAQHEAKVADLRADLAQAQHRPTLDVNLKAQRAESSVDTSVATLQLTQPLFTGGKIASGVRKALAGRDAARAALTRTGIQVTQQVANAWSGIEVARAQIRAIDRQIEAAQLAYDGTRDEAALGSRTTLDVLDAENELLRAKSDRISAEANLQVALYSLLSAMGLLTADHLKLGIPTYDPEAYYNAVKSAPLSAQGKKLDRVLKAIGKN